MKKLKLLAVPVLLGLFLMNCSTIRAGWYSKPECKYREGLAATDIDSAHIEENEMIIDMWSDGGSYNIFMGPMFLPVWPIEPPILNGSVVEMKMEIKVNSGSQTEPLISIPLKSLTMQTADGDMEPDTISVYSEEPDEDGSRIQYYSNYGYDANMPEVIVVKPDSEISISYNNLLYADHHWYKMTPQWVINNKKAEKKIKFYPARNYDYTAFEVPFAYAPVR